MKLDAPEINAADALIEHLFSRIDEYANSGDPLRDRYIGFVAVTVAAHIETLVKDKILNFCKDQNKYLHAVFVGEFQQFNGRIAYPALRKLIGRFDEIAEKKFVAVVQRLIRFRVQAAAPNPDLIGGYASLLEIRHSFSHNINASFPQVTTADMRAYVLASKRIACAFLRCIPT